MISSPERIPFDVSNGFYLNLFVSSGGVAHVRTGAENCITIEGGAPEWREFVSVSFAEGNLDIQSKMPVPRYVPPDPPELDFVTTRRGDLFYARQGEVTVVNEGDVASSPPSLPWDVEKGLIVVELKDDLIIGTLMLQPLKGSRIYAAGLKAQKSLLRSVPPARLEVSGCRLGTTVLYSGATNIFADKFTLGNSVASSGRPLNSQVHLLGAGPPISDVESGQHPNSPARGSIAEPGI